MNSLIRKRHIPISGARRKHARISPMKFLRSDIFRSFGIGFTIVTVTMVMTRFDGAEGLIAIIS